MDQSQSPRSSLSKSLTEAFSRDTFFIVPKGDGEKLKALGFSNFIEIDSWNQEVHFQDPADPTKTLSVRALPARHASNRSVNDYMQSLYMGCVVTYNDGTTQCRHLITGDTGTLDEGHEQQLHQYIETSGPIQSTSIASGPDRPRKHMECTHQSSADALVMHAKISVANWAHYCKHHPEASTFSIQAFNENACQAIAYHQGCYRLGLLSYTDVTTTVTRMLTFLDSCPQDQTLAELSSTLDTLKDSFYWVVMDDFERKGVSSLLAAFKHQQLDTVMKVSELKHFIQEKFTLPKIGSTLGLRETGPALILDDEVLILNKPAQLRIQQTYLTILQDKAPPQNLYQQLKIYQKVFDSLSYNRSKKQKFAEKMEDPAFKAKAESIPLFVSDAPSSSEDHLPAINQVLGELTLAVQGDVTYDETLREEGNFQTMMLLLANEHRRTLRPNPAAYPIKPSEQQQTEDWLVKRLEDLQHRYSMRTKDGVMYRPKKWAAVTVAIDKIKKFGIHHESTKSAIRSMDTIVNSRDWSGPSPKECGLPSGNVGFENIRLDESERDFFLKLIDQLKRFFTSLVGLKPEVTSSLGLGK